VGSVLGVRPVCGVLERLLGWVLLGRLLLERVLRRLRPGTGHLRHRRTPHHRDLPSLPVLRGAAHGIQGEPEGRHRRPYRRAASGCIGRSPARPGFPTHGPPTHRAERDGTFGDGQAHEPPGGQYRASVERAHGVAAAVERNRTPTDGKSVYRPKPRHPPADRSSIARPHPNGFAPAVDAPRLERQGARWHGPAHPTRPPANPGREPFGAPVGSGERTRSVESVQGQASAAGTERQVAVPDRARSLAAHGTSGARDAIRDASQPAEQTVHASHHAADPPEPPIRAAAITSDAHGSLRAQAHAVGPLGHTPGTVAPESPFGSADAHAGAFDPSDAQAGAFDPRDAQTGAVTLAVSALRAPVEGTEGSLQTYVEVLATQGDKPAPDPSSWGRCLGVGYPACPPRITIRHGLAPIQ
jgi:hypothetical protein